MIKIIENEMEIKKNTMVTRLENMQKEYKLSFEVNITSRISGNSNLLHFTVGGAKGSYGSKTPMIHLILGTSFLKFGAAINGITDEGYIFVSDIEIQLNEWTYIEITQIQEPLGYNYTVSMNGIQLHTIINSQPQIFYNVSCYVSNPWRNPQPGFVRKLYYYYKHN